MSEKKVKTEQPKVRRITDKVAPTETVEVPEANEQAQEVNPIVGAINILIQVAHVAQKGGLLSFEDSEKVLQSIRTLQSV